MHDFLFVSTLSRNRSPQFQSRQYITRYLSLISGSQSTETEARIMSTRDVWKIERRSLIIIPITVAVILGIAFLLSRKLIRTFFGRSKGSILPVTNTPPRKIPLQALRTWWKPAVSYATSSPQPHDRLTHQGWFQRYNAEKILLEEERCKEIRKEWKPRVFIQNYREHWNRIAEEQKKARQTQWEKFKDKVGLQVCIDTICHHFSL